MHAADQQAESADAEISEEIQENKSKEIQEATERQETGDERTATAQTRTAGPELDWWRQSFLIENEAMYIKYPIVDSVY